MTPRSAVLAASLLAAFSLSAAAQYRDPPRDTRAPDKRPTAAELAHPPKSWIDPDTGHRIIRLTDEPGSGSFYFNVNAYTPDGNEMVYTTPDGISVLDLRTLKTRSVVTGHVHTLVVGHKTATIFYTKTQDGAPALPPDATPQQRMHQPQAIYGTNVDTGVTRLLAKIPDGYGLVTVNADETLAAGTFEEKPNAKAEYGGTDHEATTQTSPMDQPANKGEMMVRRLAARIPLTLFTLDLTGSGKVTPLLQHDPNWVNHLLFSPTDPHLLMYCHEGPWQDVDRIWTIHTDGTENRLMHRRTMAMEIAGHEFWGWSDGDRIYYDLQTPKGQDFWLATLDLNSGSRTWFHMLRNEWSIHFNVNRDRTLYTGDGGDPGQVAKAPDGEWIYLFRPELINQIGEKNPSFINPGVFHSEKLVNMSKHNYTLEPNVSFTPDSKMVIFRSNMFGPTYVFGVEVAKAQ